jgi:hypothetical protein
LCRCGLDVLTTVRIQLVIAPFLSSGRCWRRRCIGCWSERKNGDLDVGPESFVPGWGVGIRLLPKGYGND